MKKSICISIILLSTMCLAQDVKPAPKTENQPTQIDKLTLENLRLKQEIANWKMQVLDLQQKLVQANQALVQQEKTEADKNVTAEEQKQNSAKK